MAICITFGTHEFTSMLQGYENVRAHCPNCNNWDVICETRWPWFTICFIPAIPLSFHKYKEARCLRCNFAQDMSMRRDITPNTRPPAMGPGYNYGPYQPPPGPQPGYPPPHPAYTGEGYK
ncbi:hypothetical protein VTN31DRAFT_1919 [Thermomyces dupontii]|uniref:uncharacterized protein n=1 Tax=Talaromyces thermophilus TaxID=28565 RepID=UPI003741F333